MKSRIFCLSHPEIFRLVSVQSRSAHKCFREHAFALKSIRYPEVKETSSGPTEGERMMVLIMQGARAKLAAVMLVFLAIDTSVSPGAAMDQDMIDNAFIMNEEEKQRGIQYDNEEEEESKLDFTIHMGKGRERHGKKGRYDQFYTVTVLVSNRAQAKTLNRSDMH